MQTEAGGIAQVVGMARDFARGDGLVVVLGDNIFEARSKMSCAPGEHPVDAQIFVKSVPDPDAFGVVVYDGEGRVVDIVERQAWSTCGMPHHRLRMPSWGCTATPPTSST